MHTRYRRGRTKRNRWGKNKESNEAYDYCKQENERRLRMRRNKFENEQEGEIEKGKQD